MEENFRIVSYHPKRYTFQVITYHQTHDEAMDRLIEMTQKGQCDLDLIYYIQTLTESPVKTKEDREAYVKKIKEEIN